LQNEIEVRPMVSGSRSAHSGTHVSYRDFKVRMQVRQRKQRRQKRRDRWL